jgi:hypothetical protein
LLALEFPKHVGDTSKSEAKERKLVEELKEAVEMLFEAMRRCSLGA